MRQSYTPNEIRIYEDYITFPGSCLFVGISSITIMHHFIHGHIARCVGSQLQSRIKNTILINIIVGILFLYLLRMIGNIFGADHPHSETQTKCLIQSTIKGFSDWATFLFVGLLDFIFCCILKNSQHGSQRIRGNASNSLLNWAFSDHNEKSKKYFTIACVVIIVFAFAKQAVSFILYFETNRKYGSCTDNHHHWRLSGYSFIVFIWLVNWLVLLYGIYCYCRLKTPQSQAQESQESQERRHYKASIRAIRVILIFSFAYIICFMFAIYRRIIINALNNDKEPPFWIAICHYLFKQLYGIFLIIFYYILSGNNVDYKIYFKFITLQRSKNIDDNQEEIAHVIVADRGDATENKTNEIKDIEENNLVVMSTIEEKSEITQNNAIKIRMDGINCNCHQLANKNMTTIEESTQEVDTIYSTQIKTQSHPVRPEIISASLQTQDQILV